MPKPETPAPECNFHTATDGSWPEYDGYGLYLTRVCGRCKAQKMARFRPDIQRAYQTDDRIEDDY